MFSRPKVLVLLFLLLLLIGCRSSYSTNHLLYETCSLYTNDEINKILSQMTVSDFSVQNGDLSLSILGHAFDGHFGFVFFKTNTTADLPCNLSVTYLIDNESVPLADFYDLPIALEKNLPGRPGGLHTSLSKRSADPNHPDEAWYFLSFRLYGPVHSVALCVDPAADPSADIKLFRPSAQSVCFTIPQTHTPRIASCPSYQAWLSDLGLYIESPILRDPATGINTPDRLSAILFDGASYFAPDSDSVWRPFSDLSAAYGAAVSHNCYGSFDHAAIHFALPADLSAKNISAIHFPDRQSISFQ